MFPQNFINSIVTFRALVKAWNMCTARIRGYDNAQVMFWGVRYDAPTWDKTAGYCWYLEAALDNIENSILDHPLSHMFDEPASSFGCVDWTRVITGRKPGHRHVSRFPSRAPVAECAMLRRYSSRRASSLNVD